MKQIVLKLTQKQLCDIRKFVEDNGYVFGCGKNFWLVSEPVIGEFREHFNIILLTYKEGITINNAIKKLRRF